MLHKVDGVLSLAIDRTGVDAWIFADDEDRYPCQILSTTTRGKSVISRQELHRHSLILTDVSIASAPFGINSNRLCWNCLKFGHNKVKTPEGQPNFYYCSMECLRASEPFVDDCGSMIFGNTDSTMADAHHMILQMLHKRRSPRHPMEAASISRALKHEQHSHLPMEALTQSSQRIFANLSAPSSAGLLLPRERASPSLLEKLLRVIHFNSQPFSVPDIPSAGIRCLFPALSLLNHSCTPNCQLLFSIGHGGAVVGSLVALRTVPAGQELTISYLSQPCLAVAERQALLRVGFNFNCSCDKCQAETAASSGSEIGWDCSQLLSLQRELRAEGSSQPLPRLTRERVSQVERGVQMLWEKAHPSVATGSVSVSVEAAALPYVYALHDVGLLLLEALSQTAHKARPSGAAVESSEELAGLTVRVCVVLYRCWLLADAFQLSLGQLSVLLTGGSAASRLVRSLAGGRERGLVSEGPSADLYGLVDGGRGLVQIAVEALDVYCDRCASGCVLNPYENMRDRARKLLTFLS